MLLCEVALGKIKECGLLQDEDNPDAEEEDDNNYDKPLDFKRFQSRKGVGKRIPDPKHTITLSSGLSLFNRMIFVQRFLCFDFRCANATWSID